MNRASPEMLHCLHTPENLAGNGTDMTVLERQRARLKWQQQLQTQQPQQSYFNENQINVFSLPPHTTQTQHFQALINSDSAFRELATRSMKADPGSENEWPDFSKYPIPRTGFGEEMTVFATSDLEMDYSISRTSSCPPAVVAAMAAMAEVVVGEEKASESILTEKLASTIGKESFKKRKADKAQNPKVCFLRADPRLSKTDSGFVFGELINQKFFLGTQVVGAEDTRVKKMKGDVEEVESKITEQNNNRETSGDTSKENSKVSEIQKPDYIHVRARRGQATDSHSLAERVRREKISERMKYLQDLVPGCNKITGKAGMLDEIINYVQSLQRQVEFLSMKLATVNPRLDLNIENFFAKETFPACPDGFPTVGMSSEIASLAYPQFNSVQEVVSCCGLDMVINLPDMGLRRTTSGPVSIPEAFIDSSCYTQAQLSSIWETDLQNPYNLEFHQGRSTAFPSQAFTGSLEANNLKMEM
ncbi:hypothetical protein HHK36_008532 [Tetracentron sinense]|uniref:BHLH domain-containing protein n=1 Tax=Tetracentron sinense TaxID=13715 RepID=A0A834ZFQ1_TETSI|nr:hypothetical protein HHK36_008532 [Tetracentron sinense]